MKVFIDSNVPMYVAGTSHPNKTKAEKMLRAAEAGEFTAVTSCEVLQEILYRYHALKRLDLAAAIYEATVELCAQILPITLADADLARSLVLSGRAAPRDALHAAVMKNNDIIHIATFDQDFDRIAGLKRWQA